MSNYPIESLLRPPVELYSSGVTFSMAAFLSIAPEVLMMTPVVAYGSASVLVLMGVIRLSQGVSIIRYKRGLRRLPYYSLKAKDVPVSRKKLFLGKGYRWRQKHVQRLRDIRLMDAVSLLEPSFLIRWARRKEVDGRSFISQNPYFRTIIVTLSLTSHVYKQRNNHDQFSKQTHF